MSLKKQTTTILHLSIINSRIVYHSGDDGVIVEGEDDGGFYSESDRARVSILKDDLPDVIAFLQSILDGNED